jgi:hypothetical protein
MVGGGSAPSQLGFPPLVRSQDFDPECTAVTISCQLNLRDILATERWFP